jgi:hypothetical protein
MRKARKAGGMLPSGLSTFSRSRSVCRLFQKLMERYFARKSFLGCFATFWFMITEEATKPEIG